MRGSSIRFDQMIRSSPQHKPDLGRMSNDTTRKAYYCIVDHVVLPNQALLPRKVPRGREVKKTKLRLIVHLSLCAWRYFFIPPANRYCKLFLRETSSFCSNSRNSGNLNLHRSAHYLDFSEADNTTLPQPSSTSLKSKTL